MDEVREAAANMTGDIFRFGDVSTTRAESEVSLDDRLPPQEASFVQADYINSSLVGR